MGRPRVPLVERFWLKVQKSKKCWEFEGGPTGHNGLYRKISRGSKEEGFVYAHVFSYQLAYGPIPDGLVVDHVCRNPTCIRPSHLRAVTQKENILSSPITLAAINARKTHCPSGHLYDTKNTYRSKRGIRYCRACQRDRYEANKKE